MKPDYKLLEILSVFSRFLQYDLYFGIQSLFPRMRSNDVHSH